MKKAVVPESSEEMLPEYDFDYAKAKPNRLADSGQKRRVAMVLDKDVHGGPEGAQSE